MDPKAAAQGEAKQGGAKRISLALQGGGAHGAFTWGVLERLLDEERLEIEGISGTSAGAMNGAVLAHGMIEGGRQGARDSLARFWQRIGEMARLSPIQPSWIDRMFGAGRLDFSPAFHAFDALSRLFSPYQYGLADFNPLRDVLNEFCDFDRLNRASAIKLFACATNIRNGKIKVFGPGELSVEALLASACLPLLFRAVEIDGEHYWDGGYVGNPALFPLLYRCAASDVVLVEVNPLRNPAIPTTARDILDRMNDLAFNSALMREMRAIAFVTRLIDEKRLVDPDYLRKIHFHMIEAEEIIAGLGASSKFNADWGFLQALHELGVGRAEAWIAANFDSIGARSTIDIEDLFI
ncbi:MAG: patatin-like phospholipase family protein [Pseudomonadota bacterium]